MIYISIVIISLRLAPKQPPGICAFPHLGNPDNATSATGYRHLASSSLRPPAHRRHPRDKEDILQNVVDHLPPVLGSSLHGLKQCSGGSWRRLQDLHDRPARQPNSRLIWDFWLWVWSHGPASLPCQGESLKKHSTIFVFVLVFVFVQVFGSQMLWESEPGRVVACGGASWQTVYGECYSWTPRWGEGGQIRGETLLKMQWNNVNIKASKTEC